MVKKSEGVVGVTGSSQDLAGKVSKTCSYVRWGLGKVGYESYKYDQIMSRRRGHVQLDGWRNNYRFVIKVRNIVYDKEPLQ